MMRDILFRGKRTDNGDWVEGMLARFNPMFEVANIIGVGEILVPVFTSTVGQYTGLTDKDGKKIFEGDIVNCYTFTGMNDYRRGVVHWNEMFCGWYVKESCSLLCGLGEIYDNPELLEGGEAE